MELEYPAEIENQLGGKEMLFMISNNSGMISNGQVCYQVLSVCDDPVTIEMFGVEHLFRHHLR